LGLDFINLFVHAFLLKKKAQIEKKKLIKKPQKLFVLLKKSKFLKIR